MCKKVLMLGLVTSMSAQAMYRGQELQVVVKTPVAQAIRWLSSGTPEANVAAGAIAASVVYSGMSLVTLPYRAWSKRCDRRMWAEQLSGIADQVQKKSDEIVGINGGLVVDNSRVTLEQIVAKVTANENFLENLKTLQESNVPLVTIPTDSISSVQFNGLTERVAVIEESQRRFNGKEATAVQSELAVLRARIVALESKPQQQAAQAVVQNTVSAERFTGLEDRVSKTEGSIKSVVTKTENLPFLAANFAKAQEDIIRLESQLKVLQNTVLIKLAKSDKPVEKE
jgi:hypothetical protein